MMSNFFCFPPKASQNNGSHLKIFPPKPQKISASAARLLGCFFMSGPALQLHHWPGKFQVSSSVLLCNLKKVCTSVVRLIYRYFIPERNA